MKIYTRTGDAGETALFDGTRVSKADPRVDAYGEVDELNAMLGLARASGADAAARRRSCSCSAICSRSAPGSPTRGAHRRPRDEGGARRRRRARLEADRRGRGGAAAAAPLHPAGGAPAGAALHVARTVCRRAERRIVALGDGAVDPDLLAYVNRLSDLLFVLARLANARAGVADVEW